MRQSRKTTKYLGLDEPAIAYEEAHRRINEMKKEAAEIFETDGADETMALETILVIYQGHVNKKNPSVVIPAMILISKAATELHKSLNKGASEIIGDLSILGSIMAAIVSAHLEVAAENGHSTSSAMCFSFGMLDAVKPPERHENTIAKILH
jgi:hypothetical protein